MNESDYGYGIAKPKSGKISRKHLFLILSALLIVSLIVPMCSATSIQKFGIDSKTYDGGDSIYVSGEVLGENSTKVEISIWPEGYEFTDISNMTTNMSVDVVNRLFSATIAAPPESGQYTIVAVDPVSGVTSPFLYFNVFGADDARKIKVLLTEGEVLTVPLSDSHGISGTFALDKAGGSLTFEDNTYYFLVSENNIVYMDDDSDMTKGSDIIGNLDEGSKVKINTTSYTLVHIEQNSEIVLARPVAPSFEGSEAVNVTMIALNASCAPFDGDVRLDNFKDTGELLTRGTYVTGSDGVATIAFIVQDEPGTYHLVANDVGHISYSVNKYSMYGDVLSPEFIPQHTFASGQEVILAVYMTDSSDALVTGSTATVIANVKGPDGYDEQYDLSFDSEMGIYCEHFTVPEGFEKGEYKVEYVADIGSQKQRAYTGFDVRGYDIFLFPVSPQRHELSGFAPGEQGYIFVGGFDLGTGEEADVNGLTDNSNKSKFTLEIIDSSKQDVTDADWDVIDLDTFFTDNMVPPWMQDEIEREARNASIISFTTPSTTGLYDVRVSADLNGTIEDAYTSIGIQNLFVEGQPTTSDGNFAPMVPRYDNVTLMIMAFDPKTMDLIPAENITDAGLIEVFSEAEGELVTELMENPHLVDIDMYDQSFKGLRFYVNDSNLGFHHVKFWINATLEDGSYTQAVGNAFFDTKLYNIWAYPSNEDGMYKAFTSASNVSLDVVVEDANYNAVSGKLVTIDEVRYGETWELVDFDSSDSGVSGTTDANGTATLTFTPTNPMKDGWYDVRVKVVGSDTSGNNVYDYGQGWFEVRSFMFDVYPETWDVQSGENVTFVIRAADPSNMEHEMDVDITLSKIYYMGSWNNPQPPVLIEGPHALDKTSVSTNASTSDTITYIGDAIEKAGSYEFLFEARSGDNTVVRRAWVESNPFVAWAYAEDWNNRFGVGQNMTFFVEASDSWGGMNMHNITTDTTVTMVMKEGMFGGAPYKTQSDLDISTEQVAPNKVNLTMNLDGWDEGNYFMNIKVVDDQGVEVFTDFWFQVEIASVGLPQFYWAHADEGMAQTTKTSIRVDENPAYVDEWDTWTEEGRYPSLNYSVAPNSYIGKVSQGEIQLLSDWRMEEERRPFWMLVDLASPQKVYINYNNANFSDVDNTTVLVAGETFEELDEFDDAIRNWNITRITQDGSVEFEGIDCLASGYNINTSLSKSGEFLVCDWFGDEEWLNVDLNGDGDYERHWDTRENLYYMILADSSVAEVYDTVLIANTTNFTQAIDATAGEPVEFGGAPIYLVNMMYQNNGYEVRFTSYKQGWSGEWLGIFQNGDNVTIPFLVQQPGATDAMSGGIGDVDVTIDEFTWHMPGNDHDIGVSAKTNEYGLAMLNINTSAYDIPNGQYLIHYEIELPEPYNTTISPMEKWRLPGLELRTFVVDASLGTIGEINVNKIYDGNGINVEYGREFDVMGATSMWHDWGLEPEIARVGWPFDMYGGLYYNTTNDSFHTDPNGIDGFVPSDNILVNMDGQDIVYNFTEVYPEGDSIIIQLDESTNVWKYWDITLDEVRGDSTVDMTIDCTMYDWDWPESRTYTMSNDPFDWIGWAPGQLDARIVNITSENVTLELYCDKLLYQATDLEMLMDGETINGEMESGRASVVNYNGYTIYGYNDVEKTEVEKEDQWWNSFDRVLVTNDTSRNIYRIGEEIPELGGEYVAMAAPWGGKMIFADPAMTHGLFPLSEWAPDGDIYYIGTFTEADVKADMNWDWEINATRPYYIMLQDNIMDGKFSITNGRFDDDIDFTDRWTWTGPIDMYGPEGGLRTFDQTFSEQWANIGELWGWPIGFPVMTENESTGTATLTTLSNDEGRPISVSENVSIFLKAKTFNNMPIDGNISVEKLMVLYTESAEGMYMMDDEYGGEYDDEYDDEYGHGYGDDKMMGYEEMGPRFVSLNSTGIISNGIGTLVITPAELQEAVGEFEFGEFVVTLEVTDSATGRSEIVERHFMIEDEFMEGGKGYY